MTIEQIDNERILIALCDEDMKSFSLEFESMTLSDSHVKEMIQRLLKFASKETGISVKNKKMLIEAIPYINGCLFLITLTQKAHKRKIYKIKNARPIIIGFIDAEDMLRCISVVYKAKIQYIHSDLSYPVHGSFHGRVCYGGAVLWHEKSAGYEKKCSDHVSVSSSDRQSLCPGDTFPAG